MKIVRPLALVLLFCTLFLLVSCGEQESPAASSDASSEAVSAASEPVSEPVLEPVVLDDSITITVTPKSGEELSATANGMVTLATAAKFASGDVVTVQLAEGRHYLAITLNKKMGEAIVYLPDGVFTYKYPSDAANYYPSEMIRSKNVITARIPTSEELRATRNLAFNPYDSKNADATVYPHASSKNQYNSSEFGAHNVLDGMTKNTAHGLYPYQSWGPNETVKKNDYLLVDFAHAVKADTLTLYLRADFSSGHDAYFSEVTVEFSDGSSIVINPTRTKDAQSFDLGGVTTSYVKLTGFVTDKTKGIWAGYTEVEVTGSELGEQ